MKYNLNWYLRPKTS